MMPKHIGVAADHGGSELKEYRVRMLREVGYEVTGFGDRHHTPDDDCPDFGVPLTRAVAGGEVDRGVAICGNDVGACIAPNKAAGVRACLIHAAISAHHGAEDDGMNMIRLGGLGVGHAFAWERVQTFLQAAFGGGKRFQRRLAKVAVLEHPETK